MALPLGFFTGYRTNYGSIVTDNFPTRIKRTAAGVTYNQDRAVSFVGPVLVTSNCGRQLDHRTGDAGRGDPPGLDVSGNQGTQPGNDG